MARNWGVFEVCRWGAPILVLIGTAPAYAAASATTMGNIGDANKASGLIRHYTLHADTRVIEATAAVPEGGVSDEVVRKVTIETAHDICADPRGAGWTLRLFLPNESNPIATCRFR
jgi:hypothetical protein